MNISSISNSPTRTSIRTMKNMPSAISTYQKMNSEEENIIKKEIKEKITSNKKFKQNEADFIYSNYLLPYIFD